MPLLRPLPAPIAKASWRARLLARFGLVALTRYTDRCAITESLEIRLDSSESAYDALNERHKILNLHLSAAESGKEDAIEEAERLRSDLHEVEGDCASAQLEAAGYAAKIRSLEADLAQMRADRAPGPVSLDRETVDKARLLIGNSGARSDILNAVGVIIDAGMMDALNDALDPTLDALAVKYRLGMADQSARLKTELKRLVAEAARKREKAETQKS